jgi:hypothetical protein
LYFAKLVLILSKVSFSVVVVTEFEITFNNSSILVNDSLRDFFALFCSFESVKNKVSLTKEFDFSISIPSLPISP